VSSWGNDFAEVFKIFYPVRVVARCFCGIPLDFAHCLQIFQADRPLHNPIPVSNAVHQHFVGQTLADHPFVEWNMRPLKDRTDTDRKILTQREDYDDWEK